MSKVEELAKKYCEGSSFEDACMEKSAYIAGYHQAEKDLELTWEDIKKIEILCFKVDIECNLEEKEHYQEVLNRFKKQKDESKNLEH